MQVSRNTKYENKKRKKIQKEHFYPNHYHREAIHDCMNEFGSMMKNPSYSKMEMKKIQQSIKRLRVLALLPFCSKHYFGME